MPPNKASNNKETGGVKVRTLQDIEPDAYNSCGSSTESSSLQATEEDRANFQKMMRRCVSRPLDSTGAHIASADALNPEDKRAGGKKKRNRKKVKTKDDILQIPKTVVQSISNPAPSFSKPKDDLLITQAVSNIVINPTGSASLNPNTSKLKDKAKSDLQEFKEAVFGKTGTKVFTNSILAAKQPVAKNSEREIKLKDETMVHSTGKILLNLETSKEIRNKGTLENSRGYINNYAKENVNGQNRAVLGKKEGEPKALQNVDAKQQSGRRDSEQEQKVQTTNESNQQGSSFISSVDPVLLLLADMNHISLTISKSEKMMLLFECSPCDKVFDNVMKHLNEAQKEKHALKWKMELKESTLKFIPNPSEIHWKLLDDLILNVADNYGMSQKQELEVGKIFELLNEVANANFPDCAVRLFGSHLTGTALATDHVVNMDLFVPSKEEATNTFLEFLEAVAKTEYFSDFDKVSSNFSLATFKDNNSEFVVQLSLNNSGARATGVLMHNYVKIDQRAKVLCTVFRAWGRICQLDRGEEGGSWQGYAFPLMVVHYLQQVQVLPVLHEMCPNPDVVNLDVLNEKWKCRNDLTVGRLFVNMLRYYLIEHNVNKHIVCVTQLKPLLRSEKKWQAKRIAIADPFSPKHNVSRYMSGTMYDYARHCMLTTACALVVPHSSKGPIFGFISKRPTPGKFRHCEDILNAYYGLKDAVLELVLLSSDKYDAGNVEDTNEKSARKIALNKYLNQNSLLSTMRGFLPHPNVEVFRAFSNWIVSPDVAETLCAKFKPEFLDFKFERGALTDFIKPPINCTSCHKDGHLRSSCPDEVIPKLDPLPMLTDSTIDLLNNLCSLTFEAQTSETDALLQREKIRNDLQCVLRDFYPDVDLHLFGSSCNGFGGRSSDVDLCLTFKNNATGEGLSFPQLVEEIFLRLQGYKPVRRLIAITTAKVPIVKFVYGPKQIQVDLSLYNMLGITNTKLLYTYSQIDPRVRPLVYMMKQLAKTTDIGDASKGSLSSYAYTLMTIFFLQQVEPPVLPVLQEICESPPPPIVTLENANVYFFSDLEKLDSLWPYRGKNKLTQGELWIKLLEFYACHTFHESMKVVCIRKKEPLYKQEKLWKSKNLCIEDPFDLTHNLGSGLSARMNNYIVRTFQRACKYFSSNMKGNERISFDKSQLIIGRPPSDRGCHFCHCIGHIISECPKRAMAQAANANAMKRRSIVVNRSNPPTNRGKKKNRPKPSINS